MIENGRVQSYAYADEAANRGLQTLVGLAGIVLLAYTLAFLVVRAGSIVAVLGAAVVVGAFVLARQFEAGLLTYLLICTFQTSDIESLQGASLSPSAGFIPLALLSFICMFWLAVRLFKGEGFFRPTALNWPMAVFLGVAIASLAATTIFWNKNVQQYEFGALVSIAEIVLWVLCGAAFLVTANSTTNRRWMTAFYWPVVAVALLVSVFQMAGAELPILIPRGTFIVAYAAVLSIARALFSSEPRESKIGYWLLGVLFLANTVWDPTWVSGWIAAGLGLALVLFIYSRKIFAVAAVVVLFAMFIYPGFVGTIYEQSRAEGDMDRATLWADATRMALASNPLLGIGPGDFRTYNRQFASIWYGHRTYTSAHSDYAQVIAELGLLGVLAFLWLMTSGVITGLRAAKRAGSETRWLAVGATAIFFAIAITSLVGDYILPSRVNGGIASFGTSVMPWMLLGAAVSASHIEAKEKETVD